MRTTVLAAALTTLMPVTAVAQQNAKRAMTTDDGLNMVRVSGALMSPDGSWVLYQQSELNWEDNKRENTYYMIPAGGGDAFQYIGKAGGRDFQFSPDGRYLSFKREVDEKQQIFLMRTTGGEAVQLTKHKTSIGAYRWTEDARRIFFVASEPRSDADEKRYKAGYDAIIVDEGPNGQRAGSWNNLWMIRIKDKEEAKVTDESFRISSFDVAPDGHRIVFTVRHENRRNQRNLTEIYLLDTRDSSTTRLTDNQSPESGVAWSPDGRQFLYSAPSNQGWELRQGKLWVMDPDTREARMISEQFAGSISRPVWTPDGRSVLFTGRFRTNSNLYRLDVRRGTVHQVTNVTGMLNASAFSADRTKMVYSYQDFDTPPDLYASDVDHTNPVRLTTANPWVEDDLALARAEVVQWKSQDGLEIEGILVSPAGHERGTPAPFLLHVHGGPAGAFTNSFRHNYHVWAGLGYVQLLPNVRGSSGYSDDLLRGNMRDIGGGDYWDLMTGVDEMIARGDVDPEAMGIRGWSYGGILGGWTITQTNRFKAASLGAMVSDWTSEYGPGFNYDVRLWYIGGTPWDNPDGYRQRSALTHVQNVETPTLLLHGINDRTDTEPQSMMFFTALKDQGKTARYVKFPREPHGFREPRHQRTRDLEEITWMQRFVRGIDWTPWEREEDKAADEKKEEKVTTSDRRGRLPKAAPVNPQPRTDIRR